jgi:3-polyprenyl-4-hydroxybenzoate decarboxylase
MSLIALGVTGGIGAYKAVELARGLQRQGHDVVAVMTASAQRFVTPLTFEAITRREVITDLWTPGTNADIEHIAIASQIDLLLVAPCTANTLGKFAQGLADDFLTSLYLATTAPVVLAPAMNSNMFAHPAVAANLNTLQARGVRIVEPGSGYLACGWIGKGRLAEPEDVVAYVQRCWRRLTALKGRTVLITAGPTYENIDPVRYIGNRSSGRMGFALAAEAVRRGATVTLVTDRPAGAARRRRGGARAQRRRHARGRDGTRGGTGRGHHGAPWPTTPSIRRREDRQVGRSARADAVARATSWPISCLAVACRRAARAGGLCRRNPHGRARTREAGAEAVDLIVANDGACRCRLRWRPTP